MTRWHATTYRLLALKGQRGHGDVPRSWQACLLAERLSGRNGSPAACRNLTWAEAGFSPETILGSHSDPMSAHGAVAPRLLPAFTAARPSATFACRETCST